MNEHLTSPHEPKDDAVTHTFNDALSAAGRARERHLRESLLVRVDRTRRRRTIAQLGSGAAVLALLAMLPFIRQSTTPTGSANTTAVLSPRVAPVVSPAESLASHAPASFIRILATDQTVLTRLATRDASPSLVTFLNDDQLLASLHDSGFPAGLVSIDGDVRIVMN